MLARKLAENGKVALFRAGSHTGLICTAWMAGFISFGGAWIIINLGLHQANEELPWFVPGTYSVVIVLLVAMGGWSILRSSRLLSAIEILPGQDRARLLLSVRRNIPLPFIKPKTLTVDASDVMMGRRLVRPLVEPIPLAGSFRDRKTSIIKEIARRLNLMLFRYFVGARQFVLSDGIMSIRVRGQRGTWKLDTYGWFLAGGDRLLEVIKWES